MVDWLVVGGVTLTPWIAGPCAALLGWAGVSGDRVARLAATVVGFGFLVTVAVAIASVAAPHQSAQVVFGSTSVHLDALALILSMLVLGLSALIQVFAIRYLRGDLRQEWFVVAANLLTGFTMLMVCAGSVALLTVAWSGGGPRCSPGNLSADCAGPGRDPAHRIPVPDRRCCPPGSCRHPSGHRRRRHSPGSSWCGHGVVSAVAPTDLCRAARGLGVSPLKPDTVPRLGTVHAGGAHAGARTDARLRGQRRRHPADPIRPGWVCASTPSTGTSRPDRSSRRSHSLQP